MRHPKKIDDEVLMQKMNEGIEQKDIAAYFKVSPAAISKRLKRLSPPLPQEPSKLDSLTPKEQNFVKVIASGLSQTEAALQTFDCGNRASAKSLGSSLMKIPAVKEALTELMERMGLTREKRVRKLNEHVDSKDASISLRALETSFKLADEYPASKNININADLSWIPVDLEQYRIKKDETVIDAETEEVTKGGSND